MVLSERIYFYHLKYRVGIVHRFGMLLAYSLQLQIKMGTCRLNIQKHVNTACHVGMAALLLLC